MTEGFGRFAPAVDADDNKEDEEEEEELISEESNEFISSSELRRNRISSKGSFTLNCYCINLRSGPIVAIVIHSLFSFRLARQNVITRRNENGAQSQVIILFSLTRETSSLFVHPQTFLDVNEIFVQFHCLSSYRNDLFTCSHILSSLERLCFVVSLGIFGSKNGVNIFSWLSINTVVAKKK